MAAEASKLTTILDVIDKRLIPNSDAKTLRGEVFTPLELVREMLFGLRKSDLERGINTIWGINEKGEFFDDDEDNRVGGIPLKIWRDPDTKWLDPANGIGNFPFIAYYMLDYQLDKHGKEASLKGNENKLKRRKHIVKNMLYMIEINKGNVNTSRKIFKQLVPSVDANIICADTLSLSDDRIKILFGLNRFDVIIGNPPFNSGGIKSSGIKKTRNTKKGKGYESIWPSFIWKEKINKQFSGSLNILKPNGFLCFIHPSSWLHSHSENDTHHILLDKSFIFIRLFTDSQSSKYFKDVTLRLSYYILQNKKKEDSHNYDLLDTENILENINQTNRTIYQSNNDLLNKIFSKCKTVSANKYIFQSDKIKGETNTGIFKNVCTHLKNGVIICKSDKKFKYLEIPKIIFKGSRNLYHFDDFKGEFGIYGNWGYYIMDKNVKILQRFSDFLNTKLAKTIMMATKEDMSFIEPGYLPDIREIPEEIEMIDDSLERYFKIKNIIKSSFILNNQTILKITSGCNTNLCKIKKGELPDIDESEEEPEEESRANARKRTRKLRRFF